jgi:peptidyl-prolyl cis-trans isomerase SurA
VTARIRLTAHLPLLAALAVGLWGWHGSSGTAAAQTAPVKRTAKVDTAKKDTVAITPGQQRIVLTVNDEAITARDIEQRARFSGLSMNVGDQVKANMKRLVEEESTQLALRKLQQEVVAANPGKSREELLAIMQERQKPLALALQKKAIESVRTAMMPKLTKTATDELIEERLKVQAAKKLGVEVPDAEVKTMVSELASKNKMSYDEFSKHLHGLGVDITTMGEKMRASKAWREMIMRRYSAQATVSQRDVDLFLAAAAAEQGVDTIELHLQRISFNLGGRTDQTTWTKRYAEAEDLRGRFSGCKTMGELAKATAAAKFDDMKFVKPSSVTEPMRSMLLSAKDNVVLPPVTTDGGVDLYAVCGRRSANASQQEQAKQILQSKQLQTFAERHLRNLKQEANIEYK